MSINSKSKRDKKKRLNKKSNGKASKPAASLDLFSIDIGLQNLFNPKLLTAPKSMDDNLILFCSKISDESPIFLNVEPEQWSRQSCCDLNVQEYIKENGGRIICGYKIWYHDPIYIEGERHAVWEKDGVYKDVTFNTDGENRILFVPDVLEKQGKLEYNQEKIRWCKDAKTKELISFQEKVERMRKIEKMSNETAWSTMLTYEQWIQGQRMPTLVPK
jgi:hypothetical protein